MLPEEKILRLPEQRSGLNRYRDFVDQNDMNMKRLIDTDHQPFYYPCNE
jgi:hypothetical protein